MCKQPKPRHPGCMADRLTNERTNEDWRGGWVPLSFAFALPVGLPVASKQASKETPRKRRSTKCEERGHTHSFALLFVFSFFLYIVLHPLLSLSRSPPHIYTHRRRHRSSPYPTKPNQNKWILYQQRLDPSSPASPNPPIHPHHLSVGMVAAPRADSALNCQLEMTVLVCV